MDRFNTLKVEFNVLASAELDPKLKKGKSKEKLGQGKSQYRYTNAKKEASKPQNTHKVRIEEKTATKHESELRKSATKDAPIHSNNVNVSPIQNRPTNVGEPPIPGKREAISGAQAVPPYQRVKANKNPHNNMMNSAHVYHDAAWDCTTSGMKRDLLQIAQDEGISLYRTKLNPLSAEQCLRPSSAVDARTYRKTNSKGKSGTIMRERKATYMHHKNLDDNSGKARWCSQTYDDENDDRAKPKIKSDYRNHETFVKLMRSLPDSNSCKNRPSSAVYK